MSRLESLLRPRSVAVVGGGAWCAAVVAQNRKIGFTGDIWPVHPNRKRIGGIAALPSIAALPDPPDAVFVGVNREATIDVIGELSNRGAGGAVCFASGFREAADGTTLNDRLLLAAGDMPILGPNCYGLINAVDRVALWPDQHGLEPVASGVAIISQSSNIAINLTMHRRGLPVAYVVAAGNQAQQGMAGIAIEILRDPRVTALGLYIESFGNVAGYEALADFSAAANKPIVALKAGISAEAQLTAISHTASLAGSNAGANALLDRLGIARVQSLGELLETLKIFHCRGRLGGRKIASLSCSGGEAGLIADTAAKSGLKFPPLSKRQTGELAHHLGAKVKLQNPLDYHTDIWRNRSAMTAVFAAMADDGIDLVLVILDFPRPDRCDPSDWSVTVAAIEDAAKMTSRPFAVVASLPENMPEEVATRLIGQRIVPLCDLDHGCSAIRAAATPARSRQPPVLFALEIVETETLTEAQAKAELSAAGLETPGFAGNVTLPDVGDVAAEIGFPVVVKGEGIAHKSERAAVAVDIQSAQAATDAAASICAQSFLVEEMITGTIAELLVGIMADPAHGFVLTLAAGGILTELMEDRQFLLLPADRTDIDRALARLKINAVLNGYRGEKPAARDAVITSVLRLQDWVIANADRVCEVEINPLICTGERAVVADALIVRGKS